MDIYGKIPYWFGEKREVTYKANCLCVASSMMKYYVKGMGWEDSIDSAKQDLLNCPLRGSPEVAGEKDLHTHTSLKLNEDKNKWQ